MEAIGVAVIGVAGVIMGALIQAFAPPIVERFLLHKKPSALIGRWKCHWDVTSPLSVSRRFPIDDVVEITKVYDDKVVGTATGPVHGSYIIEGRISLSTIALHYCGLGRTGDQIGVILLKRSDLSDQMSGSWYQYFDTDLVVGTTRWQKMG